MKLNKNRKYILDKLNMSLSEERILHNCNVSPTEKECKLYPIKINPKYKTLLKNIDGLFNLLIKETNFLDSDTLPYIRIYCITNEIYEKPLCSCGNDLPFFENFSKGYKGTCGNKDCKKEYRKKLNLKKYGVEHTLQIKELREKIKKTNILKYGYENTFQVPKLKEKIKQTNLSKYGVENVSKNKNIIEKIKQTNLSKYNVDSFSKKYIKNIEYYYNKKFIENKFIKDGIFDFKSFLKYFNISYSTGNLHDKLLNLNYIKRKYSKNKEQENIFEYIVNLLDNEGEKYNIHYNKKNIIGELEIDIYIQYKDKFLAIEYNGLMYHSFGVSKYTVFNNYMDEFKEKNKHLIKTELCENNNIQLLHINENEWLDPLKKNIWKSIIKSKLGLIKNKIYARNCIIKEISNNESSNFIHNNHIQGIAYSKINLGLYHKDNPDKLLSVMTFSKPRYNKEHEWELIRFCSLRSLIVVGGGSKLLNYFKKIYMNKNEKLISYGNRRWTYLHNNFYHKNNFVLIDKSSINYYYFHKNDIFKLYHRSVFMKYKIEKYYLNNSKKIFNFDTKLTERLNMYNNQYRRIYDSGNLVYSLKN